MSWVELKKVVNSDFSKSLNEMIEEKIEAATKTYAPSNNLLHTVLSSRISDSGWQIMYLGKWIPEYSGIVKTEASIKAAYKDQYHTLYMLSYPLIPARNYLSTAGMFMNTLDGLAERTYLTNSSDVNNTCIGYSTKETFAFTTITMLIEVEKSTPVYFLFGSVNTSMTGYCDYVRIYADEV